jgi:hypothetical protein
MILLPLHLAGVYFPISLPHHSQTLYSIDISHTQTTPCPGLPDALAHPNHGDRVIGARTEALRRLNTTESELTRAHPKGRPGMRMTTLLGTARENEKGIGREIGHGIRIGSGRGRGIEIGIGIGIEMMIDGGVKGMIDGTIDGMTGGMTGGEMIGVTGGEMIRKMTGKDGIEVRLPRSNLGAVVHLRRPLHPRRPRPSQLSVGACSSIRLLLLHRPALNRRRTSRGSRRRN